MARNAEQILNAAAKQIEQGNWTTGTLGVPRSCTKDSKGLKLMGCALGLVSILGGDDDKTRRITKTVQGTEITFYTPQYPREESPKAVKDAVELLITSTPKRFRDSSLLNSYKLKDLSQDERNNLVVEFNDGHIRDEDKEESPEEVRAKAAKWFRSAAKKAAARTATKKRQAERKAANNVKA